MTNLKKIFIIVLIYIFISMNFLSMAYATTKITEEEFMSDFQNLIDSFVGYFVIYDDENKQITVEIEDVPLVFNYDFTGDKPEFTYETQIEEGMSSDQFIYSIRGSAIIISSFYGTIAHRQDVDYFDSMHYIDSYIQEAIISQNPSYYEIIDDLDENGESTIQDKDYSDETKIYLSEFGNRVIEFFNSCFNDHAIVTDDDTINSFEIQTEKKNITPTSFTYVVSLTVNPDADFSQLSSYTSIDADSDIIIRHDDIEFNNTIEEDIITEKTLLPRTGETHNPFLYVLYAVIIISCICIIGCILIPKKN